MSIEIKSPTFPESVADGTIAKWLKKEGDHVNQDEVIVEIETDKVVLEVLAQSDGVVSKIIKPCLLYTSPSPRDRSLSRMPSSA